MTWNTTRLKTEESRGNSDIQREEFNEPCDALNRYRSKYKTYWLLPGSGYVGTVTLEQHYNYSLILTRRNRQG